MPERHQSLTAVFEHSWQLLSDTEQEALSGLGVFRGGFTRESAGEVGEVSLRTLLGLVNKSLLQRTDGGRFERHMMVQQFALGKLAADAGRHLDMLKRHADYFVALAERSSHHFDGPEQADWLARWSDDIDNLRAAFDHLLEQRHGDEAVRLYGAVGPFYYRRGYVAEGRRLFDRIREQPDLTRNGPLIASLNGAGILASHQGDYDLSRELHQEALELAETLGDKGRQADALTNLGAVAWGVDDYRTAELQLLAALELRREV